MLLLRQTFPLAHPIWQEQQQEEEEHQPPESRQESDEEESLTSIDGDEEASGHANEGLSPFLEVKRQLVDRAVSPIAQSEPPATSADDGTHKQSLENFNTPWVSPSHFDGTRFYADPLTVMFIDNPIRHTSKKNAFEIDSWMCTNIPMSDSWKEFFLRKAPKTAFKKFKAWAVWEWVSHNALQPKIDKIDSTIT
jgi:hypothetical protein